MFRPLSETKFINDANLVSYWKLDETSGTTAVDSKGSNNGTWTNFAYGTGKYGNAGSFNGSSSKISITPIASTTRTISIRAKNSSAPWSWAQQTMWCEATTSWIQSIEYKNTGWTLQIYWSVFESTSYATYNYTMWTDWNHIVMTINWTAYSLYLNWKLVASWVSNVGATYWTYWTIGAYRDSNNTWWIRFWNWLIDDVSIFSRALSSTEVLELYEGVNYWELVATPNTKLLLHLNWNSTDSSGNGNNWTDTNISYVPWYFWQGASFNGSSNINISSLSIASWTDKTFIFNIYPTTISTSHFLLDSSSWRLVMAIYDWVWTNIGFYDWSRHWSWVSADLNTRNQIIFVFEWTNCKIYKNWKNIWWTITYSQKAIWWTTRIWSVNSWSWNYYIWLIDEVILYDRAWSATEALNYYNQSKGVYAPKVI